MCLSYGMRFCRKLFSCLSYGHPVKRSQNYSKNEAMVVRKNPSCLSLEHSGSQGPALKCVVDDEWTFIEWADVPSFLLSRRESSYLSLVEAAGPEVDSEHHSEILKTDDLLGLMASLIKFLPAVARFSQQKLTYSTGMHGYGLRNLYRHLKMAESPALIVIEDSKGHVFGALVSCAPKVSRYFMGTGESVVFYRQTEWHVHKWSDENNYNIMKGETDSLTIGCASGAAAIWLDEDLFRGRTQSCTTFSSDPLCECGDFLIKALEIWTFVR